MGKLGNKLGQISQKLRFACYGKPDLFFFDSQEQRVSLPSQSELHDWSSPDPPQSGNKPQDHQRIALKI